MYGFLNNRISSLCFFSSVHSILKLRWFFFFVARNLANMPHHSLPISISVHSYSYVYKTTQVSIELLLFSLNALLCVLWKNCIINNLIYLVIVTAASITGAIKIRFFFQFASFFFVLISYFWI